MCRRRVAAADIANPGEIVRGEAGALPMADATYDLAYAIETVYFWPDLVAGLREMLRVLKPGGAAAVAVECADPVASQGWVDLVGRMEVRTPEQIAEAFRKAGFADVALFGEPTGRSALCGLHCIVGRKAP